MPDEIKAMFYTMGVIIVAALFLWLVVITEGWAIIVMFAVFLLGMTYYVALTFIRENK